ncbi:MAG: hypothetical protein WCH43_02635 [Verrucomicrobiota bacterium]
MRFNRLFHLVAILFSSLISIVSHAHAVENGNGKKQKNSGSAVSKPHPGESDAGIQDPPRKLDPALMASAEQPATRLLSQPVSFASMAPVAGRDMENTRYPWRRQIVTTTFWIGELPTKNNPVPNRASSWDTKWTENYGGFDNPDRALRCDYIPTKFIPRQNPFYVALPYNDLEKKGHKAEAPRVIPWFKEAFQGPDKSVCKGRWLAIRFQTRVVYAQWEDAGPFRTDHWEYVFGNDRPKPNLNQGAGLDVSPAVRDYLGMKDTDVTDWRFVDFSEVPEGPWARHGDNNTFVINKRKAGTQLAKALAVESGPNVE